MTYRCGWCWGVAEWPRIDPGVAYHTDQDVIKSHTLAHRRTPGGGWHARRRGHRRRAPDMSTDRQSVLNLIGTDENPHIPAPPHQRDQKASHVAKTYCN